jgi:hypothetical protein
MANIPKTTLIPTLNHLIYWHFHNLSCVDIYPATARRLAARAAGIRSTSTQVKT